MGQSKNHGLSDEWNDEASAGHKLNSGDGYCQIRSNALAYWQRS